MTIAPTRVLVATETPRVRLILGIYRQCIIILNMAIGPTGRVRVRVRLTVGFRASCVAPVSRYRLVHKCASAYACLGFGEKHTIGLQKLCRIMSHHGRGRYPCPLCEDSQLVTASVLEHIVDHHKEELNLDKEWNVGVLMRTLRERL